MKSTGSTGMTVTPKPRKKLNYIVTVDGVSKRSFRSSEDAIEYIRGRKDGGKTAKLLLELPHPAIAGRAA